MKKFNMQDRPPLLIKMRLLAACLFVSLLIACSTIRIGYNHGYSLVYWWLDAYVDFSSEQQPWMKQDIENLLAWHRKTQLSQYSQFLTLVQRQLHDGANRAELQADFDQVEHFSQAMMVKAVPELTALALSLRSDQLKHLEKKFNDNNEDFRKTYILETPARQQTRRFKRVLNEAEAWFGGFSREQEEKIRLLAETRPSNNPLWLEERIARQQKMLAVLQQLHQDKPNREAALMMVQKFVIGSFERTANPEHKAYFDAYQEGSLQIILAIVKETTPAQKAHAHRRLQGWIDDMNYLAAETK